MAVCHYCRTDAKLVSGKEVYPKIPRLHKSKFWLCETCKAYVGCHAGTSKPLGRLANAQLRKLKQAAHSSFDPLWRSGRMKRHEAYKWLAMQLGIPRAECHIGMFDEEMCSRVIAMCGPPDR